MSRLTRGSFIRFPKRKVLLNLFALLLLLVVAGFLLFPLRYSVYDASNVFTPCISVAEGREHWARPICRGESRAGGQSAEMRFNSMGIRDREYEARPAKGMYRILVLGSSNTLGPGIREEKTFPRQLEMALRAQGHKVEVINAAMVGYCSIQTSFRIRALLERYSPQLVLYQFVQGACPLFDGAWIGRVEREGSEPARIDRSPFHPGGALAGLNEIAYKHPSLFFFWLTAADQWRKAAFSRLYSAPESKQARIEAYLDPSLIYLTYLKSQAQARGAEFLLVSYRMKLFTQSVPAQMHLWLARLLARFVRPVDFTHEEIFAALRQRGLRIFYAQFSTEPLLMQGDVHLSEEGLAQLAHSTALEIAPGLPLARHK